jgi:quercetin dioxygenase-like cupin family protein
LNILKAGYEGVAIIDSKKKAGEEGQFVSIAKDNPDLLTIVMAARMDGKEIRWYYRNLVTYQGKKVPARMIITEIPSGHIQPWHTHESIHELSVVYEGQIVNVEAPETMDLDEIAKRGTILNKGDMVIEDPGVRHTIANPFPSRAVFSTVQVANIPIDQFNIDWK